MKTHLTTFLKGPSEFFQNMRRAQNVTTFPGDEGDEGRTNSLHLGREEKDDLKEGIPIPPSKPKIWSMAELAVCKTPPPLPGGGGQVGPSSQIEAQSTFSGLAARELDAWSRLWPRPVPSETTNVKCVAQQHVWDGGAGQRRWLPADAQARDERGGWYGGVGGGGDTSTDPATPTTSVPLPARQLWRRWRGPVQ